MLKKTDIPPLSKERRQYLKKQKQRKRHILYWQIGILVVFIAAWEIAARVGLIDSFILSQPTRILRTYFNMAQNDLLMHMGVTIYETLVGFLLGAALGTLLAIVLWWSAFVSKVSEPYLVVLNSLPKIALGPVIIILVGAGTKAIIFMALAISLIVTVLEMLSGFRSTDKELIKMAATFGASKRQIFTKVVFPENQHRPVPGGRYRRGVPGVQGGPRLPHRLRWAGVSARSGHGQRHHPVGGGRPDVRGRRAA